MAGVMVNFSASVDGTVIALGRERERVRRARVRAREMGAPDNLMLSEWLMLLIRFRFRCAYCGEPYETLDHIVPALNGGGATAVNVVPCCRRCNEAKGTAVWL